MSESTATKDTKQVNGSEPPAPLEQELQRMFNAFGQAYTNSKLVPGPNGMMANLDPLHSDIQLRICIAHVDMLRKMLIGAGLIDADDFNRRMIVTLQNHVHELTKAKPRIVVPR